MINLLKGTFHEGRNGYELPPQFDFLHFPIKPFQMIVVPINHTLSKDELIDIYQGVMPDSSFVAEKVRQSVKFNTRLPIPADIKPSWMPYVNPFADMSLLGGVTIAAVEPHSFLHPGFLSAKAIFAKYISDKFSSVPYASSREFYQDLKFLVFKVKERGQKNYTNYKRRQIEMAALNQAADNIQEQGLGIRISDNSVLKQSIKYHDVIGHNWPYDNFSLFENVKIDMSIEVDK